MPDNSEFIQEVEHFIVEQNQLLSDIEQRLQSEHDTSAAAGFIAEVIPRTNYYIEKLELADNLSRGLLENIFITENKAGTLRDETLEQLRTQLVGLQSRLTDVFIPFIKDDQSRRKEIEEFIERMGGTDEDVSVRFPARLNLSERLSFVNDQLDITTRYLGLKSTNETQKAELAIVRDKLHQEKRLLEQPQAEQARLREKLQSTEAALQAARSRTPSPSSVAHRNSPEPDRPKTKEEMLRSMGVTDAALARGNLFGGIAGGAGKLKKAAEDPVDKAIKTAKARGEDLVSAAIAAAEKAKTDPAVAVGKAVKVAEPELRNLEVMQKVIEFILQKQPDIEAKKLEKRAAAVAAELSIDDMASRISAKQAIIARRKKAGEYTEVTGARKQSHEPRSESSELSEIERVMQQRRMKSEMSEKRPNTDEAPDDEKKTKGEGSDGPK